MLTVANLGCERDERVLFERLSFTVTAGTLLQIQGANGSGKTTLLRILAGLNHDYTGELQWQGKPCRQVEFDYRQALFYLGHAPSVNRTLTPLQNLRWFCALRGFADDAAIHYALNELGLRGYADIPCYQMSAGQQRRVSLARLALTSAPLWIMDEPFTALDRKGVAELEQRIDRHVTGGGAVVLTTHHPLQSTLPLTVVNLDALREVAV
ncbi:MAG TPA: cytochrome c biogenesis heme-transporting ATPase CcmA [Candidatus Acidoferrum sp.]|nr:cytochrome c biogenesis heme-transporting ATPase CcmA [Candidatus Acidoferrum sp.]